MIFMTVFFLPGVAQFPFRSVCETKAESAIISAVVNVAIVRVNLLSKILVRV